MSAAFKSVLLTVCLLAYRASCQPTVTVPVTVAVPSTATRAPGMIGSLLRPMINGGAGAANSGLDLVKDTVQFKASAANRVGQGAIGVASSLTNMGIGLTSDGLTFGTAAASRIAGIGENLASMVPFTPVGAAAKMGAEMIRLGLNTIATGGNMALGAAQTVATAKTNIMSSGLSKGTGMVADIGSGVVGAGQSGVNMGAQVTNQVVDVVDDMIVTGSNMVAQGVAMVSNAVAEASTTMEGMAERAKTIVDANIAATLPGASVSAGTSTSG